MTDGASENHETEALRARRQWALRKAYAEQLPGRVRKVEGEWQKVDDPALGAEAFRSFRQKVRSLVGSSATFGFDAVSEAAGRLEVLAESAAAGRQVPADALRSRIERAIEELKQSCLESSLGGYQQIVRPMLGEVAGERGRTRRIVCFLTDDAEASAALGFEFGCFGYLVRRFTNVADLSDYLRRGHPAAILVDAEPFEERLMEATELSRALRLHDAPVPMLFLSRRADFDSRLEAVRAGAGGYFVRPTDTRALIDKLELLTRRDGNEPYRILILSCDYSVGLEHSLTLQRTGMTTSMLTDPRHIWRAMVDFQPDLLLLDIDLGEMNGMELATVIRQQDSYLTLPILLMASEDLARQQMMQPHAEVNDVLTTPISQEVLVAAVGSQVQRARALHQFSATDSLTGLLSHTKLFASLDTEVDRAVRKKTALACAVIDIDHLRSINETFGHLAGDAALRGLARLLQQRLRRTDVLGRYGGDEFAVVMPETDGPSALKVLDGVRQLYAEMRHHTVESGFSSTFSGGVVALPGFKDAAALRQAAWSSLLAAQRQGRNRIVLGGS